MSCAYSMIMDHYWERWEPRRWAQPLPLIPTPLTPTDPKITQEEIDEFHRLLERAREHDRKAGRPECELEEKKQRLRDLAKELGVEITFP